MTETVVATYLNLLVQTNYVQRASMIEVTDVFDLLAAMPIRLRDLGAAC
jgi:hypothetical protein